MKTRTLVWIVAVLSLIMMLCGGYLAAVVDTVAMGILAYLMIVVGFAQFGKMVCHLIEDRLV